MPESWVWFADQGYQIIEHKPHLAMAVFQRDMLDVRLGLGQRPGCGMGMSLGDYLGQCVHRGIEHLTLRVPVDEAVLRNFLERMPGCEEVARMVQFTLRAEELTQLKRVERLCAVRDVRIGDFDQVLRLADASFSDTRFCRDDFFSHVDCRRLYRTLAQWYFQGREGRRMMVGVRDGEVACFFGGQRWQREDDGASEWVWGHGLAAVAQHAADCYPGLLAASCVAWHPEGATSEYDAQQDDTALLQAYRLLGMQEVAREVVFHAVLQCGNSGVRALHSF